MPKLTMLCGLPGCGKSTWAHDTGILVFSSDSIRKELYGSESDQTHNNEVFTELHKRIRAALKNGTDCIYDATNLSAKRRKGFLKTLNFPCEKEIVVFAVPYQICTFQDSLRERHVGEKVIMRMMKQFQLPHKSEGWDSIRILRDETCEKNTQILNLISNKEKDIPHDCNPVWHTETVQEHIQMCLDKFFESPHPTLGLDDAPNVYDALKFHDVGKFFTKSFYGRTGERKQYASFYNHENVSTYLYLTSSEFKNLKIVYLIQYHMEPYHRTGYAWDKFCENFTSEFISLLKIVNYFDDIGRKTDADYHN